MFSRLMEYTRNGRLAEFASAILNVKCSHKKGRSADDDFSAGRTVGVVTGVPRNVAHVWVMKSGVPGDGVCAFQGRHRGRGKIAHLVIRMETRKM